MIINKIYSIVESVCRQRNKVKEIDNEGGKYLKRSGRWKKGKDI